MSELAGRKALVTGSGHGIGAGIALALAQAGADVVVHYGHSAQQAEQTAAQIRELGVRVEVLQADVTDTKQVDELVAKSVEFLGGLDIVVANAGHLIGRQPIDGMTDEHFAQVMDVNVGATFRTVRAAIPHLRASEHGRVITMSSLAAMNGGGPGSAVYAAAKAAVRGLTKGLAKELGPDAITVNALAPGYIKDTAFHNTFSTPESQAGMAAGLPLKRGGTVAEVGSAVVWLCSDGAAFVSGATIDIDGGAGLR